MKDLVSIVLPAYNEAKIIEDTVKKVREKLLELDIDFEIIIAENGSTDGTDKIAKNLSEKHQEVRYLHTEKGRGNALRAAFNSSKGDIIVYMDVDLATDLKHLKEIIDTIRAGNDIATGSRLLPQSVVEGRRTKREVASKGYNLLVRTLLGSKIHDHQCGFKAFKKDSVLKIIDEVKDNYWFLDTEILVRGQKNGYNVAEIPIRWTDTTESKVDMVRDILGMGSSIFCLWWDFVGSIFTSRRGKFLTDSGLSLLLLLFIAIFIGYHNVLNALFSASMLVVLLAGAFFISSYLIRGIRYTYILKSINVNENLRFSTGSVLLSQMANLFLPSRLGDILRPMILKDKRNIDYNIGFASITIERIFDITTIASIGLFSYGIIIKHLLPKWLNYFLAFSFILIFFVLIFVFLVSYRISWLKDSFKRILYKISTPGAYTDEALSMLKKYVTNISKSLHNVSITLLILCLTFVVWILETITCLIIFKAFAITIPVAVVFLAISFGNIIKIFPTTPGSIGIYEVILTGIFTIFGVPLTFAFSIAILDHLVKNVVTLSLGSVAMFKFDVKFQDMNDKLSLK